MPVDVLGAAAGAVAVSATTLAGARAYDFLATRRRYGHLYALMTPRMGMPWRRGKAKHVPRSGLQLVLPSIPVREFEIRQSGSPVEQVLHESPPNVLFMPMAEGISIGRLVLTLRSLKTKCPV